MACNGIKTRNVWLYSGALAIRAWGTFWLESRFFKIARHAIFGSAISIGYTINVVVFVELLRWPSPELASALSFIIWTPISYVVHRDLTFLVAGHRLASFLRFLAAFVVRLVASAYTVHLAAIFGLNYMVGVIANWTVLPLISYFILDLWVFRPPSVAAALDRGEPQRVLTS